MDLEKLSRFNLPSSVLKQTVSKALVNRLRPSMLLHYASLHVIDRLLNPLIQWL